MNAYMNIQVRVLSARAVAELRAINGQLGLMQKQMMATSVASNKMFGAGVSHLTKWGNQIQWAGRQLQYNFTLPIAIAGIAAAKFALDNEKAFVRVVKVYGDAAHGAQFYAKELNSLKGAFKALSETFGIAQSDAINIAADWAAAGASGLALAKSVKLTMETMILGEMEAADATQALIAIQAQYGLTVDQLSKTIDILNMVENQTGITMQGLIQGFQRAAGAARTAGVDTQHLAAMMAAMTPAAGSAAQAGNALKTIFSRLLSPTKEATEVLGLMGINTKSLAWQTMNGSQRVEELARAFSKLSAGQRAVVSAVVASRWQINKFDVLMRDIVNTNGYYQKALRSTSDELANYRQRQFELNTVLNSNPQRLKQIWVILKNAMADVIQPLIPFIVGLAGAIANLAKRFSELDPSIQKLVIGFLILLAAIGPIARYIGSVANLLGLLAEAGAFVGRQFIGLGKVLFAVLAFPFSRIAAAIGGLWGFITKLFAGGAAGILVALRAAFLSPWGIVIGAVITLLLIFQKQVIQLFQWMADGIRKAFYSLPEGVQRAFIAVIDVVKAAAQAIYGWLQWLNPFARHSPSLVESVTTGMAVIAKQYETVSRIGGIFAKANRDLAAFKSILNSLGAGQFSNEIETISKGLPSALPLVRALISDLASLNSVLDQQAAAVAAQEAVVKRWKAALDAADKALDAEQRRLDDLEASLSALTDAYQAHQDALSNYANAPIQGMKAMEDQIFANEQAQKRLRLEMLKWEEVNGSIDDTRNRLAALQGDIELMHSTAQDLVEAGAGSDILGPINEQIAAMEQQQKALQDSIKDSPITEMQKQLNELQRQGEIMDLEKSLQFDPLTRQIDQLANGMKELPFDEIIAGINTEKTAMANLQPKIDAATAAVNRQKLAVDAASKARDALSARYDIEQEKLSQLNDAYSATEAKIREIESAIRDVTSAAQDQIDKLAKAKELSPGAQNFLAAAGANFPDVGGAAKIGREGGIADQSKQIEDFTKQLTDDLKKKFGEFDLFGPIRKKWNEFTAWIKQHASDAWNAIKDGLDNVKLPEAVYKTIKFVKDTWNDLKDWFSGLNLGDLFGQDIKDIFKSIGDSFSTAWDKIRPELEKFRPLAEPTAKFFRSLWSVIKLVAKVISVVLIGAFKIVVSVLKNTVGPAIDVIVDIFKYLIRIIRGVVEVFLGIFTLDWDVLKKGIVDIFSGIGGIIVSIIIGAGKLIWGAIKGVVTGVIDWFKWLWDQLVGHSIIPDMLADIVNWFKGLPQRAWNALIVLKDKLFDVATKAWNAFTKAASDKWNGTINWIKGLPQAAYDKFIAIKNKLATVSALAWAAFLAMANEKWRGIISWVAGLPQAAYNKFISIKDKLITAAKIGFQALIDKAKELVDGKVGFMSWIGGIPGRIGKALGSIGSTIANALKTAWNATASWINKNGIANVNKITTKFGLTIPNLPTFATGGVIPGRQSRKDNVLIAARTGEGILVPEAVRALGGASGLKKINDASRFSSAAVAKLVGAGLPGFADGGVVGWITSHLQMGTGWLLSHLISPLPGLIQRFFPRPEALSKVTQGSIRQLAVAASKWGQTKDAQGSTTGNWNVDRWRPQVTAVLGALGLGTHVAELMGPVLRRMQLESGGNPNAINLWDINARNGVPSKGLMQVIDPTFAAYGPRYNNRGIWDPYSNIYAGLNYARARYGSIQAIDPRVKPGGYDAGGWLPPGINVTRNATGRAEPVFSPSQWATLTRLVALSANVLESVSTRSMVGMGAVVIDANGRLRAVSTATVVSASGSTEPKIINFHGNLVFPNITTGDDAKSFIDNLKSLTKGN